MNEISEDTVGAISLMASNFGIAEKDSAKVMKNLMHMGNMSSEAALNLQAGAIHLAEAAGVAPAEVIVAAIPDHSTVAIPSTSKLIVAELHTALFKL